MSGCSEANIVWFSYRALTHRVAGQTIGQCQGYQSVALLAVVCPTRMAVVSICWWTFGRFTAMTQQQRHPVTIVATISPIFSFFSPYFLLPLLCQRCLQLLTYFLLGVHGVKKSSSHAGSDCTSYLDVGCGYCSVFKCNFLAIKASQAC